jgi:hypothetical protein
MRLMMKRLVALVLLLNTSLFLVIATLALVGCDPALHQAVKTGEELETEELASSFKDYFVGTVKARVYEAELSEDRKRVPWTGYGVDGGFPGTVVTAIEITNASGTYDLPADMVDDLGNPNGHVHVRLIGSPTATRAEERLEFSMSNSDGAGGYQVLFQVDLAKAQARRFVEIAIDDNPTRTHDWTAITKRKETKRKGMLPWPKLHGFKPLEK